MKWFEKHLNWTAVCIVTGVGLLFALLFLIGIDFYYMEKIEVTYKMLLTNILPIITGCFLLLMICLSWILIKKKRSLLYLLFFVPLYIFILTFIIVKFIVHFVPQFEPGAAVLVLFLCSLALLIIGLIIPLFLRNLSKNEDGTVYTPFYNRIVPAIKSRFNKVAMFSIITIIILLTGLTGYSNYSMDYAYLTYSGKTYVGKFSYAFEYPQSFYLADTGCPGYLDDQAECLTLGRDRIRLFQVREDTWIYLRVWFMRHFDSVEGQSVEDRNMAYLTVTAEDLFSDNPSIKDLEVTSTMVDDTEADYVTMIIEETPDDDNVRGTLRAVTLEQYGLIWVIIVFHPYQENLKPDPTFEHITETFRFIEMF